MAKRCPEEFNPWPPFVDIFASVILVMLLFLLITIVNIGYYAQFKYKISYAASTETPVVIQSEEQAKVTANPQECTPPPEIELSTDKDKFSFHKTVAPSFENANNSLFEGGKKEGNAVSYAVDRDKKEFTKQHTVKKELVLTVEFEDKEIFLNSHIKRQIKLFISDIKRRSQRAEFVLYVSDPTNVISSTISKQISLGRILNVKSIIKKSNIDANNIKMDLRNIIPTTNQYGNITIKAHLP